MPVIAIISQIGRGGKTTLAIYPAAAAQDADAVSLIIDTDPQATASQWASWHQDAPPKVIDSPPPRLAAKIERARGRGGRKESTPRQAARVANRPQTSSRPKCRSPCTCSPCARGGACSR